MQTSIPVLPPGDVLVYKYGVRLDKPSEALAVQQIIQARRLYNDLVACMRDQVLARSSKELELAGPGAAAIQDEIEALTAQFTEAKTADDRAAMESIAAKRREAWTRLSVALKDVRAANKAELKKYLAPIGRSSASATYQLRSKYVKEGLGWATANAVLDSALQAFQSTIKTGQAPRFARADDKTKDTLSLQFTTAGGVPASRILSGDHNEFKLTLPREGIGRRRYGDLLFRMGAAKVDKWAVGTWQAHRPIPEGANVAAVSLVRERLGTKFSWNIQLLLKLKEPVRIDTASTRKPLAVVHLGWSADSSGRRIGAIADAADPGLAKLLQLPSVIEDSLELARAIQSDRDAARDDLHVRLKGLPKDLSTNWPSELADEFRALLRLPAQHVAIQRLHRLLWRLKQAEVPMTGIEFLEDWRKADKHRHQSTAGIAKRARYTRRDWYRKLALDQCMNYSSIIIDSPDLKESALVVDKVSGEHSELSKSARAGRVVAALYEYTGAIKWAGARCSTAIIETNGKTVNTCSACGCDGLETLAGTQYQQQQCPDCGAIHDRKCNAAAIVYQKLCKDAESFSKMSEDVRAGAAQMRIDRQSERLGKLLTARREGKSREPRVSA